MRTNQLLSLLPDLGIFVRVVETGSFSAAAQELSLTPSAVSRQISRLEQGLGLRLLERTTRRLRLSEMGSEVYLHSKDMLNAARASFEVSERFMAAPRGTIVLSAPKAFARQVLQPLIPDFLAQYPEIDLQLLVTDSLVDLIGDRIDLAIRITATPPETLVARPLCSVAQILCASTQYLAQHGTPQHPNELTQHQCLFLGETSDDHRWQFRRANEMVSVAVKGRYAVNHSEMRLDGVLHHLGIACLPQFTVPPERLARGDLCALLEDWQFISPYQGTAWILYSPNRFLAPKLRVLIDYLTRHLTSPHDAALAV